MHLPNWIPKGYWVVLFIRLKIQPNSIRFIADISLGIWDYLCSSPHNWYTTALFRLAMMMAHLTPRPNPLYNM
jgi:hypothetical protein